LVAVVMRQTFVGTGLMLLCSCLRFRVWVWFHWTEANVFYVSIWTTQNYEFDKIKTAGVTGNATNYKNRQGDNPMCWTRDEISQPSRPFSPRAATAFHECARISCVKNEFQNAMFHLLYFI